MKYEMTLIVPAKLVGTILELLDGEGCMVRTTPHTATNGPKIHRRRAPRGGPNAGIKVAYAALQAGLHTSKQIEDFFESKGLSRNSAGPRLCDLRTQGKAKQLSRNEWALA